MGKHTELTYRVIGAYYSVYNELGHGFLEQVYERALSIELASDGIHVTTQTPIPVFFKGSEVGRYFADLVVEDAVLVELKATRSLLPRHNAQLLNYLKATRFEVGLLLNFGPKSEVVRRAFENHRKGTLSWTSQGVAKV